MADQDPEDDKVLHGIRSSLLRAQLTPERVTDPAPAPDDALRATTRKLSRSRVSLILRQLRAVRGYSYAQIMERTGLSQQILYDVEYRDRRLTLEELSLLADCYGVSVNDILGIDLVP